MIRQYRERLSLPDGVDRVRYVYLHGPSVVWIEVQRAPGWTCDVFTEWAGEMEHVGWFRMVPLPLAERVAREMVYRWQQETATKTAQDRATQVSPGQTAFDNDDATSVERRTQNLTPATKHPIARRAVEDMRRHRERQDINDSAHITI